MKKLILILLLVALTGCNQRSQITINNKDIEVELAITQAERLQGLMFRESLNGGMLFLFEEEKIYPFWMKNTLIPLDMIWINENLEVVHIAKNIQPCQETCNNIKPSAKAKYVLELNALETDKFDIKVGDKITLNI